MDSLLSNAMNTVLGTTETAVISIRDDREDTKKDLSMEKSAAVGGGGGGWGAVAAGAAKVGGTALGALGALGTLGLTSSGDYNKEMRVQFNPSSIRLHSHVGDDDAQKFNFLNNDTGIGHGALALHVDMTVKLIFDGISNNLAFTQDALNASTNVNAMIGAGADALKSAAGALLGGARQSVQVTMEAFIAALRNNKTRRVKFSWGEMKYEGVLNRLNSTYTMFDILGRPVRGEVEMTLYLADPSIDEAADAEAKEDYWRKAYFKAFVDGGNLFDLL